MRRWNVVFVVTVVVVVWEAVHLSSAVAVSEERAVTEGRETPMEWPACLKGGRRRRTVTDQQMQYAVVIDAGSSGSRVRVYRWPSPDGIARVAIQAPGVEQIHSHKIEPGLSAHASDLERVADDIQDVLTDAAEHVPGPQQRTSPVYIMATAGKARVP